MAVVKVIGSYANKVFVAAGEELQVYAMQYDTITVNGTLTKLNGDLSGGTSTFLGLTDTPSSYSGQANKVVSVKSAEDGLEFKVIPQGTGSQNQVVFWDLNNQLKAITGIEYESTLDALALIGDTIYGDYGETFWSRGYVDIRRITDSYNPFLAFWRSRQSGSGAVQNNDLLGRISALGHDGTDWSSGSRIRINLRAAQNWSSTAHGTKLDVEVTPTGSTTPVTAVTIDENGLKNERTNTVRTKDYTLTVPGTGTAVLGSGTTNTIPKFTGTNAIGDSSIIDSTNITFSKNVDFAKYKAIAMACDNGSTLPTSPVIGQWFLHTPPGRKVLMMYGGSSWIPIISLGSMTLYVDGVNGTDSQDRGFGTGTNAFKTIQYAINQIPGQYSGDVTINIASGTYGGFILRGKYPTGDYYIYINGTLQTDYTGTITSGTIGSAENYCTITVSGAGWTPNQWVGYIAEWNNQYSVIMSNTSNTLTVVGKSTVTPSGTLNIKSQAVTLSSAAIIYSDNVYLQNLYANNATMYFDNARNCFIMFCKIRCNTAQKIWLQNYSQVGVYYTYVFSDSTAVYSTTLIDAVSMIFNVYASYWNTSTGSATRGIRVINGSQFNSNGGIFAVNGFYIGIQEDINSTISFYTGTGMKNRITNCTYGIYMTRGSHIGASGNLYYSGNTTNYYAEAASYAYYG